MGTGRERLSVAVIGCGAWGANLARCFAELGALKAVADRSADRATVLAAKHDCADGTPESVILDPAIDALAVATPPSSHYALAAAGLERGKHVLVEKPLTLHRPESEALARDAEARGRVLMVGHILRYHPAFEALLHLVRDGALGELQRVHASRLNLGAIRREEDALWCLAPHDVSMILALAGEMPEHVEGFDEKVLGREPADAAAVRLGFPSGLSAMIQVSWLHPVKEHRLSVIGSKAMAVFDDTKPWEEKLVLCRHQIGDDLAIARGDPEPVPLEPGEPLKAECRHFLDSITTGATPLTDAREALAVMDVLARAEAAIRETRTALVP